MFSTKNIGKFQILRFEIKTLSNDVVSFEQPGPGLYLSMVRTRFTLIFLRLVLESCGSTLKKTSVDFTVK